MAGTWGRQAFRLLRHRMAFGAVGDLGAPTIRLVVQVSAIDSEVGGLGRFRGSAMGMRVWGGLEQTSSGPA